MDAYTPDKEREEIREKFHDGEYRVVCNVGVMTTGVDWDVRCIILARPTKSDILFCMDYETEILTSHGWLGAGQVKVGDCVAVMADLSSGKGAWSRVTGYIDREMNSDERWIEYDAPRANFRVTDQHRMIAHSANDKIGNYQILPAIEMAALKGGTVMPTAVHMEQTGVPLNDAELYFIGMMMTDGTWTSTSGSISQSERHPEILGRIEKCLHDCVRDLVTCRAVPRRTGRPDGIP